MRFLMLFSALLMGIILRGGPCRSCAEEVMQGGFDLDLSARKR